jgi:carbamoyltransferase
MTSLCRYIREKYSLSKLCLAGGVCLNVAANTKILLESGFEEVFIQPAAGDDGQALGKLLYRMNSELGLPRRILRHAYLGPNYTNDEIKNAVIKEGSLFRYKNFTTPQQLIREVASRLERQQVIAWFQGSSELGPRALGHRSILADPRRVEMRNHLNSIKRREDFQPFALSILSEYMPHLFDLPCPSPFMLLAAKAKSEAANMFPAGLHIDNTCRLQTLTHNENELFYELVEEFMRSTGVSALLNTSFNDKGEPIVETPADAVKTFTKMQSLDALAIGSTLLER